MKYISIGAVLTPGTEHIVDVSRGTHTFPLTGIHAALWLNGRTKFSSAVKITELQALDHLCRMGLAVTADETGSGAYWALTRCTVVPAEVKHPYWFLSAEEKRLLVWLRNAGLVLSMAEIVFLMDRQIMPTDTLLGRDNAQRLVEQIYTRDTIFDNILENQMEKAAARDQAVNLILRLLRKKRIVLL